MLNFLAGYGAFAVGGLIAATAPIIIHLLNRRRFRVTEWAAMDFLREAVRRNRRILRLRDLILLTLRTLALALFGLALARPFFSSSSAALHPNEPIHAVLVVDNSLSMGYQKLDGSVLLDDAKARVREFLEELPEGSIVSLIPLCGGTAGFSREAYRTKQDVRDALEQIQVTDRAGSAAQMVDLALDACRHHPDIPSKRVVFLSDLQRSGWPAESLAAQLKQLPDLQVVAITPDEIENTWIADFRVQDGIADLDTPALFTAVVRHEGPTARRAVEVKLTINGTDVDSKVIDLEPGQAREVTFSYRFDIPVEEGRPTHVPAQVSIPHDRQRADDARYLMVPVMLAVPVLFIDQHGSDESPAKNRFGETRALRRLLAPVADAGQRQLVQVRHIKVEQLDRKMLESARLVVIAGVADPGPAVPLLRDFVKQGGQLLIAAGGDFDAAAWTRSAWLDGAGILAAPLAEQAFGQTPEEAKGELRPFFLSFASMAHDYFHLADTPREQMEDLYRRPFFFKAVVADTSEPVLQVVRKTDISHIEEERARLAESLARLRKWSDLEARGQLSDADKQDREKVERQLATLRPSWLLWKPQEPSGEQALKPAELADRWRPHVLASYDNNMPFLVQRALGQGQILFVSSGVFSSWDTLPRENAILVFNRILRAMLESTLAPRNLSTVEPLTLAVTDRHAMYQPIRPDSTRDSLTVDALGPDQFGVTVRPQTARGFYRLTASRVGATGEMGSDRLLDVPLAVNGPEQESEPVVLDEAGLRERLSGASFRWVGRGEAIRLEGGQVSGQDLWKWLLLAVVGCLLLEMTVLAWPMLGRGACRMNFHEWLGYFLGIDNVKSVESVETSFAAPWANRAPAWIFFACLALVSAALVVYYRYQPGKQTRRRLALAGVRAVVLSVLVVMLADPVLTAKLNSSPRPQLWFVFDGTESMALQDKLSDAERERLGAATGLKTDTSDATAAAPSRMDYVRAWLQKKDRNLLARLGEKYRLRAFIFDGPDGVRSLAWHGSDGETVDTAKTATLLTTGGQVTALGKAFEDLAQRRALTFPAGVVMVSDFDNNSGPAPLAMAKRLGVPVYAIGVGPTAVVDLAIDLQAPPVMKKSERSTLVVTLRQSGLEGQKVPVTVKARRLGGADSPADSTTNLLVGQRDVELKGPTLTFELPYTPEQTGRFEFLAEVPVLSGEVVEQNNRASREVNIRDDFLRLLYVEYEPTWEWRFIKEVFHRDPLVGERGFRTFLRSSDPRVRKEKSLFQPSLTPPRSEFFANDVIFLGDMPAETLNQRFCEQAEEFVGKFGGGLVIVSGPRFGPGQLAATPLAKMLPVVVDADARRQDRAEFPLRLTGDANQFDFMQLGNDDKENLKAWQNLGPLPWYQPVARVHPLASVLAEHPTDRCADGKTPQPLIAIRRYGRGEVVYLGFDETWRLRRRYGEKYYRQFWGQMIHRLGLSHALGTQKRFVVRTDRPDYHVDDKVTLTVEAYDSNFEVLADDKLADRKLTGELLLPVRPGEKAEPHKITLGQVREGVFEARIPVTQSGDHTVRVKDPVTGEMSDVSFQVTGLSLERRSAARNVALQTEIAQVTGGVAYDLETADRLPDEIHTLPVTETSIRVLSLWNTWVGFGLVVGLLIAEWLFRKMIHLP